MAFTRKGRLKATARARARISDREREQGMDMLEQAEDVFVQLGAPSRIGTAVFSLCATNLGIAGESPLYGHAAGAAMMGYACRLATPGLELGSGDSEVIEDALVFDSAGELDYDAFVREPDHLRALVETTVMIADDRAAVAGLAGVSVSAWEAFVALATHQLQDNLLRNGLSARALPTVGLLEALLRLGYTLRVVDEIAGEWPTDRQGESFQPPPTQHTILPEGSALVVDDWLSDAAHVARSDFEPLIEYVLQMSTIVSLGIADVPALRLGDLPELDDDVVIAISNARFGYALRNREIQLVEGWRAASPDDRFGPELDIRGSGAAVLHGLLNDVLTLGMYGGSAAMYRTTPGTTPEIRATAIRRWAEEHYPGDDATTGSGTTIKLVEYGYLLHWLVELRPGQLE